MPNIKGGKRLISLVICSILVFAANSMAAQPKGKLTTSDKKVIDFLVNDWGKDYSVTSLDIAMDAVGVKQSEETHFRIGSYIKAHPELHEVIRRWGWVTLVLTPDEKLIARVLIDAERDGKPGPSVSEIANAVGIGEEQTKSGLSMLERYEILKRDNAAGGPSYTVVPRYLKWEPRLDFLFHTVTLERGRRFNTN